VNDNPYSWTARRPKIELAHPLRAELESKLCRGELLALVGGHGMGKSVLLSQLAGSSAIDRSSFEVVLVSDKPHESCTERACIDALASHIGSQHTSTALKPLIDSWMKQNPGRGLILLYDEIDRYVEAHSTGVRDFLNALTSVHGEHPRRLSVIIAGGLGLYKLESELGSTYMSRATLRPLEPFAYEDIERLAEPFADRGTALTAEVLDGLRTHSGGIPALVVYGLQHLWESETQGLRDVFDIFARFRNEHGGFERSVYRNLGIDQSEDGGTVHRVWRFIDQREGPYLRKELLQAQGPGTSPLALENSLRLLQASGLIRIHGSIDGNPLVAEGISSILRPLAMPDSLPEMDRRARLQADLLDALAEISRWSADYCKGKSDIVQESVFSAILGTSLARSGWQVERESLQGPGRPDLKLSHPLFPEAPDAIIEVKIWPRNDYVEIHAQTVGYCVDGPPEEQNAASVMIASRPDMQEWASEYHKACLQDCEHDVIESGQPHIRAFRATRTTDAGAGIAVTHYLLNLPRRAHRRG
jgi:hypothetical protein